MLKVVEQPAPKTTTDVVFEALQEQILSLQLLPGARLSEADVAAKMGVSRQPVRDAFNRLSNLQLVKVRPQRATIVAGFSMSEIQNARFVRLAVELEIGRLACAAWDATCVEALEANLVEQRAAMKAGEMDRFHQLDYDFHDLICTMSGHPLAFQTILNLKQKVDRLCVLTLAHDQAASAVLADHEEIAAALADASPDRVERVVRLHLGRLDDAIADIHEKHAEYFE